MKSNLQILGAGSRECASHSLYYFLEQNRILFNVSEGLQRLATQFRLKISPSKLNAVFLTRLDWECFGGLPGLILTMGDTARLDSEKSSRVRIVGPRHLKHAIAAMRPFLHRRDFAVEVEELCVDDSMEISHWRDEKSDVDVWAYEISTSSKGCKASIASVTSKNSNDEVVGNAIVEELEPNHFLVRMFQSEFSVLNTTQTEREDRCEEFSGRLPRDFSHDGVERSLVYVVQGPSQAGKFDKAAAVAQGLKPGPQFGALSRGETVQLSDGRKILPESCVGPKRMSPAFMIIDVATPTLARSARSSIGALRELLLKPFLEKSSRVGVVIHLLGEDLVSDSEALSQYREFCAELSEQRGDGESSNFDFVNYFCAPNDAVLMSSSVDLQLTLSKAFEGEGNGKYFPSGRQPANFFTSFDNVLRPMDKIIVAPDEAVQIEAFTPGFSGIGTLDVACANENTANMITDITNKIIDTTVDCDDIWISALGTGSAIPGKYRNVSSSLIESVGGGVGKNEIIFLDCGEMTLGQMNRLFGHERCDELLRACSAILVSHKHGDHHLGALSLIQRILKLRVGSVLLVAPERFKIWLEEFGQVSEFGLERVEFVSCSNICQDPLVLPDSHTQIKAFEVDHCYDAFGFQLTFSGGSRIVYSGDTRPCDSVIDAAHECDLLVHEATMSNDLHHEALIRKHCTIDEAVGVGLQAKSRAMLLTHFSQRYAKGALSLDPSKCEGSNLQIVMGVDLLRFPLKDVGKVSALASKMSALLPVDDDEEKEVASL